MQLAARLALNTGQPFGQLLALGPAEFMVLQHEWEERQRQAEKERMRDELRARLGKG